MELHLAINDDRSFRRAPKQEIVASVPRDHLDHVLRELQSAGYDSFEVLFGSEGLRVLDQPGHVHGLRGRLVRGLQQLGTEEANLDAYAIALRCGRAVLGISADLGEEFVVKTLAQHDAQHVVSYGRWSATEW